MDLSDIEKYRLERHGPKSKVSPESRLAVVPTVIDPKKHTEVLAVWNEGIVEHETLEMLWPKLVAAIEEKDAYIRTA